VGRRDGRYLQTVKKRRGRSVGLFEKNEWECAVANGHPDLAAAQDSALAPLIGKKLRKTCGRCSKFTCVAKSIRCVAATAIST
jgi:hypothetical protein